MDAKLNSKIILNYFLSPVQLNIKLGRLILDTIMEMQAEGAIHEGEFYTSSGNWVQLVDMSSKETRSTSTWDPKFGVVLAKSLENVN